MDNDPEYGGNRKHAAETAFKEFHKREIPTDSKLLSPAGSDDAMLIKAKKLGNPVMDSKSHTQMQRELKLNSKLGINVLGKKSELSRVFQDRKSSNKQQPAAPEKSEFEQMLEKRRSNIEEVQKKQTEEDNLPEFMKVKQRLGQK